MSEHEREKLVFHESISDGHVLVVPESISADAIGAYFTTGVVPEGAHLEEMEAYLARGRVSDCDCDLIQCVCEEAREHDKRCRLRVALTCAVPFPCNAHGRDVCPTCDACNCTSTKPR